MHILYVHQNFPAQFGHIAHHLVDKLKWRCTFVSETAPGIVGGIEKIQYKLQGGATKQNHFCSRTFENTVWHCDGVYRTLKARPDIRPDLIVGHSGFGSTLFLREMYPQVPIINFFEYYYHPHDAQSDMDFRKDLNWQIPEVKYLRSRCRNAMILLDLQTCQIGYTPTQFQKSKFPKEYNEKLNVIFDGVDRTIYHGQEESLRPAVENRGERTIAGVKVPADTRVVTYCSRGFESMRGFDIFMRAAKIIEQKYPNVVFIIVGTDRIAYGGDENYTGGKSFKDWTMAQDNYDLTKFHFVGRINPLELGRVLASGDLHIYLTVPFVLSWSMMDAMSCGAVVLGSDTAPVQEMIRPGENGLLANFFDPEDFANKAVEVLKDPAAFRPLGRAAEQMITERYSLDAVLPSMLQLYEDARQMPTGEPDRPPAPPMTTTTTTSTMTQPMRQAAPPSPPMRRPAAAPQSRSPFRG